jgi:predicted DNA-binding transcriptional regulator YafY
LLEGYRTKLTGLTIAEAEALLLAGLPGPAAQLGLAEALAASRMKLLAALPEARRLDAQRIGSRFHLDPISWYREDEVPAILPELALAVWRERRIRIGYESWKNDVQRAVSPLGLVLKAGIWYLVGSVEASPRLYRASNIRTLRVTEEVFERPADFDLASYWRAHSARFVAGLYRDIARLRVRPARLPELAGLSAAVGRAVRDGAGTIDETGWCVVEIPIERVEHARSELLKFGADLEVLAPAALRAAMADAARDMAALYRMSAPAPSGVNKPS